MTNFDDIEITWTIDGIVFDDREEAIASAPAGYPVVRTVWADGDDHTEIITRDEI